MKERIIRNSLTANRLALSDKGGFTIIEMLVAIVVLALGIMGISSVFPLSLRVAQNMKAITKGTVYAHQKLEELRTLPYNHPLLDAGNSSISDPAETLENNYIRQCWVDGNIPMSGMRRVRVKVKWTHPSSDSVEIFTYITNN